MTREQQPITPPPELVKQWYEEAAHRQYRASETEDHLIEMAAQWGANQELEACVEWISKQNTIWTSDQLRAARRPKPPSLKQQALQEVDALEGMGTCNTDTIRRALEALPE